MFIVARALYQPGGGSTFPMLQLQLAAIGEEFHGVSMGG